MGDFTVDGFNELIRKESPLGAWLGLTLEEAGQRKARVRLPFRPALLRPGGVVNGPVIMALADFAMYALVMSVAPDSKMAVTTSLHTHFLRRTTGRDLVAEARVLRSGRRLVVCEVVVHAEGQAEPVAHVTGTYALPADAGAATNGV